MEVARDEWQLEREDLLDKVGKLHLSNINNKRLLLNLQRRSNEAQNQGNHGMGRVDAASGRCLGSATPWSA